MVVKFYFVISISTVFLNRYLMAGSKYKFNYPLTMTWFQLVVAIVCIIVTYPLHNKVSALSFLPDLEFKWDVAKEISPLTIVYIGMLAFNNLCLNYVDIHLYQIARSLTICFTVVMSYFILGERTSWMAIFACFVVFIGYVTGAVGEVYANADKADAISFSWYGLFFGLASSVFVALNGIMVKSKLSVVQNNHWILLIYNTVLAIVFLFPLTVITGEIQEAVKVPFLTDATFWFNMTITAICGYLINIAFFLQINYTSALTNTISGTAKACLQTLLGVVLLHTPISFIGLIGTLVSVAGSTFYSRVKFLENMALKAQRESAIKL
jgi:GDP-fucose transporter C1